VHTNMFVYMNIYARRTQGKKTGFAATKICYVFVRMKGASDFRELAQLIRLIFHFISLYNNLIYFLIISLLEGIKYC